MSLIDEGEKRNSYNPSRPDKYYGNLRHWRGWEHFLGKINEVNERSNGREAGEKQIESTFAYVLSS